MMAALSFAKSVSNQVFKSAGGAGIAAVHEVSPQATRPLLTLLGMFIERQQDGVRGAQDSAGAQMKALTPALEQLDLETLNGAATDLSALPTRAATTIYDRAFFDWEYLSSKIARPSFFGTVADAVSSTVDAHQQRDPDLNVSFGPAGESIPGVLEVGLIVDATPGAAKSVRLKSLILRSNEVAAKKYLKSRGLSPGERGS